MSTHRSTLRRAAGAMLLGLLADGAAAAWEPIAKRGDEIMYVDATFPSRLADGGTRFARVLMDPGRRGADGTRSITVLVEFNCERPRYREVALDGYDGSMATGLQTRRERRASGWMDVAAGGNTSFVRAIACTPQPTTDGASARR